MKLLILAFVIAFCMAVEPEVKTYEDLRSHIESFEGTTLVMFFDPEAVAAKKTQMIKDVNKFILSKDENKKVKFMQSGIVVDNVLEEEDRSKAPALMVDELQLDLVPMKHMPTLAAFRNGWATWVHGDDSVAVLANKLEDFDEEAEMKANDK